MESNSGFSIAGVLMETKFDPNQNVAQFIQMCDPSDVTPINMVGQRELFEKAVRGNDGDIDHYIVCNTRLISAAVTTIMKARRCAAYLLDDMFSAGLVALTRSVKVVVKKVREYDEEKLKATLDQWGNNGPEIEVPPYLYVAIYREIRDLYERDSSEPLTKRRRKANLNFNGSITRKVSVGEYVYTLERDHTLETAEVLQGILSIAETTRERDILTLRLTHTDQEIADTIGMSKSGVRRIRIELHKKFCKDNDYAYH